MTNKKQQKKQERILDNFIGVLRQYVSGKGYQPQTQKELAERLDIAPQHNDLFKQALDYLVDEGILACERRRYCVLDSSSAVITGTIRMHKRGFGFVQPDDPILYPEDIFIPPNQTSTAVDGDRVEAAISGEPVSEKGPEGRVLAILERGRTHIAGVIRSTEGPNGTVAYVPLLGTERVVEVHVPSGEQVRKGDRVVLAVKDWGDPSTAVQSELSHVIGHISDPSKDIAAAIEEFDLHSAFPNRVKKEAQRHGRRVPQKTIREREDLRNVTCVTIDPETAKDFDDAISLEKDKKGNFHLGVHIADVSYYVTDDSQLDKEASQRCNSTYFPGRCVPMLPPELSENLCSLRPDVNRLTVSVFLTIDPSGTLIDYRISRTVIKSRKRFSYPEAKKVLDGRRKSQFKPLLERMVELCHLFKKKRYERGSIEFPLPDLIVVVDPEGNPQGTKQIEYDITHQMIEEFMLKANEVVARHLSKEGKGLTYRVHESPAEENLKEFAALANAFGFEVSSSPQPEELQMLFEEAMQTPYGPFLATSYIRSMRQALYSPDNIGHYGLGLEHYCHFTSPIRRYVDLVVHRILFGDTKEEPQLAEIANRCSEQERLSAKAEKAVVQLKKLRLLQRQKEENSLSSYEAVVTKVKPFGFSFEVLDYMLEGFVHISALSSDYFIWDAKATTLRGRSTGTRYHSGDRIHVMLRDVDLILLEAQWDLVEEEPEHSRQRKSKSGHKRAKKNTSSGKDHPNPRKPRGRKSRRR